MRKGFTLIELLSVVILISVLIVVSVTAVNYLTKKREGDVLSLKLKTFHSTVSDYMDKNSNVFKEKEKYVYCLDINQFMNMSKYTEKDFLDMYDISDITDHVIKISFDNPSNFDLSVVETTDCISGIRKDNISLIGKFGTAGSDHIIDIKPYGDKYVVVAEAYYGITTGKKDGITPSFMSNTISKSATQLRAVTGDKDYYIALVDKDFAILKEETLPYFDDAIIDVSNGINVLIIDGSESSIIGFDASLEVISTLELEIPYYPRVEEMIFKNGFYFISFSFDQRNREGKSGLSYGYDKMIVKLDQSGNVIWSKPFGSDGNENSDSLNLVVDAEGSVYYTFRAESNTGDVSDSPFTSYFDVLIKLDKYGDIVWKKYFETSFNYLNDEGATIIENRGYIYAFSANASTTIINKISSVDGSSTDLLTFSDTLSLKKIMVYKNELYFLGATLSNEGIFDGLNPSNDWNNYVVKLSKDGPIVKRIVTPDEMISDVNMVFDNNGILVSFSNYTDKGEIHVIRINDKTLEFEQEKIFLIGDYHKSDVVSFGSESILFFNAKQNLHDISSFQIDGDDDYFFARISW